MTFITLEGGEGAGKTTLRRRLEEALSNLELSSLGRPVVVTHEPGSTELGKQIRQLILTSQVPVTPMAELCLFLADRAQHLEEVIRPALARGAIVLCDRFCDSTIAYQGAGRQLRVETVTHLCQQVCGPTQPKLTLYLDIDPEIGLARSRRRSPDADRMEKETWDFHKRVRAAFLDLARREHTRIEVLNAEQTPEQVFLQAWRLIQGVL
jgi:dTMP kinase